MKKRGKQIRRSLNTNDRATANRKLREFRNSVRNIDPARGTETLAERCDRFLKTVRHQKPKTIERKSLIVSRVKLFWPGGSTRRVSSIRRSDVLLWLSQFLGPVSRNLHLAGVKELFELAVADGVINNYRPRQLNR